jgi:hypothetical protein
MSRTPGPWRLTTEDGANVIRQARTDGGFEDYVASTWGGFNEADARLIAAAPELLEACINLMSVADGWRREGAIFENAIAAIQKAATEAA